jgi:hypothetical protein
MTGTGIVSAAAKQKGGEHREDESEEEGESSEHISHSMVLQCVDTLLGYIGQKEFKFSDITVTRKLSTAVRRILNSSQKQVTITHYFPD